MTLVLWAALAAFGMTVVADSGAAFAQAQVKRVRCKLTPRVDLLGNSFIGVQIKVSVNNVVNMVAGPDGILEGGMDVWVTSDPTSTRLPAVKVSETFIDIFPVDETVGVEWDSLYDPLNPDPTQIDPILDIDDDFAVVDETVMVYAEGWWLDPNDIDAVPVHILSTKPGTCVEKAPALFKQDTRCDKNADRPGCPGFIVTVERAQYEDGKGWNIQGLANADDSVAIDLYDAFGFKGTVGNVTATADGKWSYKGDGGVTPVDGDTLSVSTPLGTIPGFSISIK